MTDDASRQFNAAIRAAAGIGAPSQPTDEIAAARERVEQARASGDAAAIEAAAREAESLIAKIEGTGRPETDFAAGVGRRSVEPQPDMSAMIRAAAAGAWVRGGGTR